MRRPVLVLFAVAVLFAAGGASAQGPARPGTPPQGGYIEKRTDEGAAIWFPEDTLPGTGPSPYGDTLRRPPGVTRVGLLRPRMNFVSEMLKSVENL